MHEVANFMRFYPAYKVADVLEEYAITFYALLNEGYRLLYQHYGMLAQISDLPMMKKEDRDRLYRGLDWASKHPADILKPSSQGNTPAEIKRMLKG